jgi:hypothetical protein
MSLRGAALFLVVGACSGSDDTEPKPLKPEICDNGEDDNGNDLVDCDDTEFCGGLACRPTGDDDDDTTVPLADVEVDFDEDSIDFVFTPQAGLCSVPLATVTVINRNEDVEALIDANCDLVGGKSVIGFDLDGANAKAFIVDEGLDAASSVDVGVIFVCQGANQEFSTNCRIKVDLSGLVDEAEFVVNGVPQ